MLIEAKNVSAGYYETTIVNHISLHVCAGEVVGLIGPNGAGKSTLLRALSGILSLQTGSVALSGEDLASLSPIHCARLLSFVAQTEPALFDFLVRDVVLMGRYARAKLDDRKSREGRLKGVIEDNRAVNDALADTESTGYADRLITKLSGGEHRRALIARAVAQDAPLMMLDEPVAHLDLKHQIQIMQILRTLVDERQKGCLVALRDLNLASEFCDRLYLMVEGRILVEGPPDEALTSDSLLTAYGAKVTIIPHPSSGRPMIVTASPRAPLAKK